MKQPHELTNEEILAIAEEVGPDLPNYRIRGFYTEAELSFGQLVSGGGEGVAFFGVDTHTGERVEAYYAGMTVSLGVSTPLLQGGAGGFAFSGAPEDFGDDWAAEICSRTGLVFFDEDQEGAKQ